MVLWVYLNCRIRLGFGGWWISVSLRVETNDRDTVLAEAALENSQAMLRYEAAATRTIGAALEAQAERIVAMQVQAKRQADQEAAEGSARIEAEIAAMRRARERLAKNVKAHKKERHAMKKERRKMKKERKAYAEWWDSPDT